MIEKVVPAKSLSEQILQQLISEINRIEQFDLNTVKSIESLIKNHEISKREKVFEVLQSNLGVKK